METNYILKSWISPFVCHNKEKRKKRERREKEKTGRKKHREERQSREEERERKREKERERERERKKKKKKRRNQKEGWSQGKMRHAFHNVYKSAAEMVLPVRTSSAFKVRNQTKQKQ